MLSWWNLPQLCTSMRPFIWAKIGVSPLGRKSAWSKNLWKKAKNSVFAPNLDHFFKIQQKQSNICCVTLHCISGKTFKQIWPNLMGFDPRNQKTDLQGHIYHLYLTNIGKKNIFFPRNYTYLTNGVLFYQYWWPNTVPKYFLPSFNLSHFRSFFCHLTNRWPPNSYFQTKNAVYLTANTFEIVGSYTSFLFSFSESNLICHCLFFKLKSFWLFLFPWYIYLMDGVGKRL